MIRCRRGAGRPRGVMLLLCRLLLLLAAAAALQPRAPTQSLRSATPRRVPAAVLRGSKLPTVAEDDDEAEDVQLPEEVQLPSARPDIFEDGARLQLALAFSILCAACLHALAPARVTLPPSLTSPFLCGVGRVPAISLTLWLQAGEVDNARQRESIVQIVRADVAARQTFDGSTPPAPTAPVVSAAAAAPAPAAPDDYLRLIQQNRASRSGPKELVFGSQR